jgi:hypothetical protein
MRRHRDALKKTTMKAAREPTLVMGDSGKACRPTERPYQRRRT